MNRKAWKVACIRSCFHGGVQHHPGEIKVFYSLLKAKHFLQKAPEGYFELVSSPRKPQKKPHEKPHDA